ncbi:MAG: hypothetical protein AAB401_21220 [Acidobacteriota bacterium]
MLPEVCLSQYTVYLEERTETGFRKRMKKNEEEFPCCHPWDRDGRSRDAFCYLRGSFNNGTGQIEEKSGWQKKQSRFRKKLRQKIHWQSRQKIIKQKETGCQSQPAQPLCQFSREQTVVALRP